MVLDDCKTANWSPNSQEFAVLSEENISIFTIDGHKKRHIIDLKDLDLDDSSSPRWSPDGKHLAFIGWATGEEDRLYMIPSGGGQVTELAPGDNGEIHGLNWSPDGKWISFLTNEVIKVRPEGTMWEADFEEILEKLQQ